MMYLLLITAELTVLFFLSRKVQSRLGNFLYRKTRSKTTAIYIMSILFLPGTFIHEMAHFLFALFLLVPVGEMELLPKIEEGNIRLGSVALAKTDPVRRFLIGIAPFLAGIAVILGSIYLMQSKSQDIYLWQYLLAGYLIFTVSNTLFTSKKDMEGIWGFIGVLLFILILFVIFGIQFDFDLEITQGAIQTLKTAGTFLLIPLSLDIIALLTLKRL